MDNNEIDPKPGELKRVEECVDEQTPEGQAHRQRTRDNAISMINGAQSFVLVAITEEDGHGCTSVISSVAAHNGMNGGFIAGKILEGMKEWARSFKVLHEKQRNKKKEGEDNG